MSASISILGNTGRDVELKYTPQGVAIASFSIASNTFRNTPEGRQKKTDWFNVTAFGKVAETLAQNVRKGTHLLVHGRLTFNPWQTQNGEPRAGADIVLSDFEFAGRVADADHEETGAEEIETTAGPVASHDVTGAGNGPSNALDEPFVDQF